VKDEESSTSEANVLTNAIAEMMGGMGIPSVEFMDEDGRTIGRIESKLPPDVVCDVPSYPCGTVSIKRGDRIRCWWCKEHGEAWEIEGKKYGREAVGTVMSISPKGQSGQFRLVYEHDDCNDTDGPSFCSLKRESCGWARVVEKLT